MVGILLTLLAALLVICLALIDFSHGRASSSLIRDMRVTHKDARKQLN